MLKGQIIGNISNLYQVQVEKQVFRCTLRGKMRQEEFSPVVGDYVEIEPLEKEKQKGSIEKILPRKTYSKRPKIANLTQMIFVLSCKAPKPDFLFLDKQLAYAEYLHIKPILCINKIDLGKKEQIQEITEFYGKIGYPILQTNAKERIGIENVKKVLKGNLTAFSGNSGVRKVYLIELSF